MSYIKNNKSRKVKFILLLFVFFISGFAILPIVRGEAQKPFSGNLSVGFLIPVVQVDALVKDVHQKVAVPAPKVTPKIPQAHLKITKIGVDAVILDMGVTSDKNMAVPNNGVDVGWFSPGTRPGETGSAVIGAHNRFNSKDGVFAHLDKLERGDVLSVVNAKGVSVFFVVRDIRTYDAMDANTGIFESESGIHLNLVTCSGDWDPLTKSSPKRLVVFTDSVETINIANKIALEKVEIGIIN